MFESLKQATSKLSNDKLVELPGKDATDEDKTAFNKAMGVPEAADGYEIALSDGRILGDDDKPISDSFSAAMHPVGANSAQVSAAVDWYLNFQQEQVAQQEEADVDFHVQSEVELKKGWGGDYKRNTNTIPLLFEDAEAGAMDIILSARTPDGQKLGDHPVMVRTLATWAVNMHPAAQMNDPDGNNAMAMDTELENIAEFQRKNEEDYYNTAKGQKMQDRRLELIKMRDRVSARA